MEKNLIEGFVVDIESDGFIFESTKVWTICLRDLYDKNVKLKINPFKDRYAKEKVIQWLNKYSDGVHIIFHNGLGFDIFVMNNLVDMDFTVGPDTWMGKPVQFVDTFYLSMFLAPDRPGHSVEYFGGILGLEKIDWREEAIELGLINRNSENGAEFMQYHPKMDTYCERDTDVNALIYFYLVEEWIGVYGHSFFATPAFKAGQKAFFLMSCQELSGWKFDIDFAKTLAVKIEDMMEEVRADVEPKLPPRSLKKSEEKEYTMPAKLFKQDGSVTMHFLRFMEKHGGMRKANGLYSFYGEEYEAKPGTVLNVTKPMEMGNQDQMKEWFLEQGWEPTLWNFKRGPDGKPMRDPITRETIKTSPKIQEAGKICPNLETLEGDLVKKVVTWLSLRNRQSVLSGWMENPRLLMDGRIGAGRTGIAATHRQKHKVVVNVPKASDKVLLGYEFRSLWICEDGFKIAAADAAALEGRVQGHYTWKYDGGVTAEELLKGDVHSKNAYAFYGTIYEKVAELYKSPDFTKDNPEWIPYRNKSKNGYYAIMYGAMGPKVASTLGIAVEHGQAAMEAFWEANPGTAKLKENLEKYWATAGKKKYLPAIDGRILCTRKKSALLNTIFQSCGGIAMDYAGCFMDHWLGKMYWEDRKPYYIYKGYKVRRIGYFHDELEYEAEEPIAQEVGEMVCKAIKKAGEFLKINVPLEGEAKIGINWKETH